MSTLSDMLGGSFIRLAIDNAMAIELQKREIMTLEILEQEFSLSKEQLQQFASLKIEKMREAREASTRKR